MTAKKKEIENEVIVANVGKKGDSVVLDLRFTEPRFEEPTEQRLERVIEPLPKSQMEKAGREVAKGYMDVVQKQLQKQVQPMTRIFPRHLPPDTIRITLSKQEYIKLGRPTVDDKLTLKLGMKATR